MVIVEPKNPENGGRTSVIPISATAGSRPQRESAAGLVTKSVAELLNSEIPPILWAIQGFLPEGLSMLAGMPKLGKSWLSLYLALAVARGDRVWGRFLAEAGDVLYLALEDSERRLKDRLRHLLGHRGCPDSLRYSVACRPLNNGGIGDLRRQIEQMDRPRLIVIDTLAAAHAYQETKGSLYKSEYDLLRPLQQLAVAAHVAILLVHHTRKAESDDPLKMINGTNGLGGAVDQCLILQGKPGTPRADLVVKGRDVDTVELPLQFVDCRWSLSGKPPRRKLPEPQKKIWDAMRDAGKACKPKEIAELTGLKANLVRSNLCRMVDRKVVKKVTYGRYSL
jgi:hypothetical protein